jgi:hypothetical protein
MVDRRLSIACRRFGEGKKDRITQKVRLIQDFQALGPKGAIGLKGKNFQVKLLPGRKDSIATFTFRGLFKRLFKNKNESFLAWINSLKN